ncbi:hypothetical protein [Desulfospira joergensenii]|uniref:hypothetical protein n=1 Tax=Desulfospira joergensenii TaxID=53329 RepID=UPI0003B58EBD|nr:hypothetical protein [Desulfospira joergensenii]
MKPHNHLRIFILVTTAWLLFWAAGLPDYYQQYSTRTMIFFDLIILPPIWFIIYLSVKKARPGRAFTASLWWAFYISVPLFVYDLLYAGIFLGHGLNFLGTYWYLTVYYILPWIIFPPTGRFIDKKRISP